ncbi:MAG: sce7725 family protein [Tannerellaceae bacterium]|nr:sce7725 family protein [Tannerellaceae bacterium]
MYYPYLRGKQFELLALRDFADDYGKTPFVSPIIEPVKSGFNSMKLAIRTLMEKEMHFFLIINPQCGEVQNQPERICESLHVELQNRDLWTPAFVVTNNNYRQISTVIAEKGYHRVMIMCKDGIQNGCSSTASGNGRKS